MNMVQTMLGNTFFDENDVKDSAPEELKAECKSDKNKYERSSNCL